jgi:hypothetical protein
MDVNAASPLNSMEKNMETPPRIAKTPSAGSRLRFTAMAISVAALLVFPAKGYTIPVVEVGLNILNSTLTEANTLAAQAEALLSTVPRRNGFWKPLRTGRRSSRSSIRSSPRH